MYEWISMILAIGIDLVTFLNDFREFILIQCDYAFRAWRSNVMLSWMWKGIEEFYEIKPPCSAWLLYIIVARNKWRSKKDKKKQKIGEEK